MTYKTYFNDKRHYHNFKAAWSRAVNSSKSKSRVRPCDEWLQDGPPNKWGYCERKLSKGTGTIRIKGWITAEHHLLYNILRGVEWDRGFAIYKNYNYFANGLSLGGRYNTALDNLVSWHDSAIQMFINEKRIETLTGRERDWLFRANDSRRAALKHNLAPFDGTVTIEMLAKLEIPTERSVVYFSSDFGIGLDIVTEMYDGKFRPTRIQEILDRYVQLTKLSKKAK